VRGRGQLPAAVVFFILAREGVAVESFTAMVIRSDGPQVTVRDVGGSEWRCVLRGRLRRSLNHAASPVVVGDRVEVQPSGPGTGVVEKVWPRRSHLTRRQPLGSRRDTGQPGGQVLAANLDRTVVVVAAPPRPMVIDRYLALVRAGGCDSLVCVNKLDLVAPDVAAAAVEPYRLAGVPVVLTSALRAGEGAHTTTWAATCAVAGGLIVDTPGLREIGFLEDEGRDAAEDLFPEITALAALTASGRPGERRGGQRRAVGWLSLPSSTFSATA